MGDDQVIGKMQRGEASVENPAAGAMHELRGCEWKISRAEVRPPQDCLIIRESWGS
jgi:hypothetical protein